MMRRHGAGCLLAGSWPGRYVVREWYRAKEWANPLLTKLNAPAYGCIAVLDRTGGGHVVLWLVWMRGVM